MKKLIYLILTATFISLKLFATDNLPSFYTKGKFFVDPVYYEHSYQLFAIDYYVDWKLGLQVNKYTIALRPFCYYESVDGKDISKQFEGALFTAGGFFDFSFEINKWMKTNIGIGGLWQKDAYKYLETRTISTNYTGLAFNFDWYFYLPWKYMNIVILNDFSILTPLTDMNYTDSSLFFQNLKPNYKGGVRLNFHPYITWLSLFVQVTGSYWYYTNQYVTINTGFVKGAAGISLSFSTKNIKKLPKPGKPNVKITKAKEQEKEEQELAKAKAKLEEEKKQIQKEREKLLAEKESAEQERKQINQEKKTIEDERKKLEEKRKQIENLQKLTSPIVKQLYEAEPGTQVKITSIVFKKGTIEMMGNSMQVLDDIVTFLTNTDKRIDICVYSEKFFDPIRERELSVQRAKKIVEYLKDKGVSEAKIKINNSTLVLEKNVSNEDNNALVIFTVLLANFGTQDAVN